MSLPLAAIVHDEPGIANVLLRDFALRARAQGWRVRGVVQDPEAAPRPACYHHMELIDVDRGERYLISQDLGSGSAACCLDPAGVAAASVVLRRALQEAGTAEPPHLIIANRFGVLEAEGMGFVDEMAAIVQAGIPLLTAVARRHAEAWERFTGGLAEALPPDARALDGWWAARCADLAADRPAGLVRATAEAPCA